MSWETSMLSQSHIFLLLGNKWINKVAGKIYVRRVEPVAPINSIMIPRSLIERAMSKDDIKSKKEEKKYRIERNLSGLIQLCEQLPNNLSHNDSKDRLAGLICNGKWNISINETNKEISLLVLLFG